MGRSGQEGYGLGGPGQKFGFSEDQKAGFIAMPARKIFPICDPIKGGYVFGLQKIFPFVSGLSGFISRGGEGIIF